MTDFSLKIDKKYTYKGKQVSVLSAKCIGGKIQAKVTAKFYDNSQLSRRRPPHLHLEALVRLHKRSRTSRDVRKGGQRAALFFALSSR